ncbi:MAG: Tol-Pal system beta propeller repeat protein TolB [Steroidobacteraceae bacterium]|nr:Tol-Pal system beta propeller repeat protein TolB [Steroidobacteraceae bacterium]
MTDRSILTGFCFALLACLPLAAQAQLRIEITSGVSDPIPIAIVPFARSVPGDGGMDIAAIVQRDLEGSGRFRAMARSDMIETPSRLADIVVPDWRTARNDYIAVGRVLPGEGGTVQIEVELLNLVNGQRIAGQRFVAAPGAQREAAHRVSDLIYEKILGVPGAFATRIAYVAVDGQPPRQTYRLVVADADGEGERVIAESGLPLMSPAWSPDGEWLAYVSFESRSSAIWLQRARTGERRRVIARPGINGSPAFSPDGKRLAVTLSTSGGNLDVYLLELDGGALTRVTSDPAIDTEAVFSADGRTLYFTSDRAGNPQIYRVDAVEGAAAKRVTFTGSYNARSRLSPDGRQLAMVTLANGGYRIAVQDLASGVVRQLSKGPLDESPSFAPNGAMLIYAGRERGRGVLATVAVDGLTTQRLKSDQGEVREPVWGPRRP